MQLNRHGDGSDKESEKEKTFQMFSPWVNGHGRQTPDFLVHQA
jgi:hypothetical protein